eukprot:TRINITY_DN22804_c0_g1_i1.p1 TRINITY_DN22804_c0_g1~~TRINITY_DN22804_c0_g1_i1.p1  ORF type:complete len:250 (+),score=53.97 TRINITY_DN22804_c0_g1_i1:1-750(+)
MIRRPPRSTQSRSSAASDVYKRQGLEEKPQENEIGQNSKAASGIQGVDLEKPQSHIVASKFKMVEERNLVYPVQRLERSVEEDKNDTGTQDINRASVILTSEPKTGIEMTEQENQEYPNEVIQTAEFHRIVTEDVQIIVTVNNTHSTHTVEISKTITDDIHRTSDIHRSETKERNIITEERKPEPAPRENRKDELPNISTLELLHQYLLESDEIEFKLDSGSLLKLCVSNKLGEGGYCLLYTSPSPRDS